MVDPKYCTGCEACASYCPVSAIQMEADDDGFFYPQIDTEKCIQCGLCHKTCPVAIMPKPSHEMDRIWMFEAQDEKMRNASSSGGAFSQLARQVIEKDGLVFGCRMDEDCYGASHTGVDNEVDLAPLRGSKYVQSRMGNALCQVKRALEEGKWVLFSGTPCQVAGLQSYLGDQSWARLLTVDLICHGVPSQKVWQAYAKELEEEAKAKLTQVSFRDKKIGWQTYSLSCGFADGSVYSQTVLEDLYLRGFIENLYLRPSCHNCSFKGKHYKSDITLGDFWGIGEFFPELSNKQGISLVISHTNKGVSAINSLDIGGMLREVTGMDVLKHNSAFYRVSGQSPFRNHVLAQVGKKSLKKLLRKYCGYSLEAKVRKKMVMLKKQLHL